MRFLIYALIILYVLWPVDLIPDFIVGGGWIEDIALLGILAWYQFVYRQRRKGESGGYERYDQYKGDPRTEYERHDGDFDKKAQDGAAFVLRDPYEILGIEKGASPEEIKSAYRRLVNQYHPDKVTHLGEEFRDLAEKKFKEIQNAYQELMPDK